MRVAGVLVIMLVCGSWARGQQAPLDSPGPQLPATSAASTSTTPRSEKQETAQPAPAAAGAVSGAEGFLEPAQVKELLHKLWLAQYRINDLLTEVHPERWKLPEAARLSFNEMLAALHQQLGALEEWRGQFDARPDSAHLGYETYRAIGGVLPRLDGVARSITRQENPSLGAQFSQAGNQLFDLQQTLGLYLGLLLSSQDQILLATQSNLAACQNQLSAAMRGRAEPVKPMKNVLPEFKGRRQSKRVNGGGGQGATPKKPVALVPAKRGAKRP